MSQLLLSTDEIPDGVPGAQTLLKGIDILLLIGGAPGPLRFRDIERAVGIPRASLHRLVAALVNRQLLQFDPRTRTYQVGNRVLELSRRTLDQNMLIRAAKPETARLARQLRRTICLMVPDGRDVFVLDFEDPDPGAGRMVRLWPRFRALDCAGGRAILSALQGDERDRLLGGIEAKGGAPHRIGADISVASALGYAAMTREPATGRAAVAAPVVDDSGHPIGAIVCLFENETMEPEAIHEAGRTLAEAARRASGHMGMRHATPPIRPKPEAPAAPRVEVMPTGRDFVGENPVWNERRGKLYWVDVLAPALRWWDPHARTSGRIELRQLTGGLAFDADGRAILAGEGGFFVLDLDTGQARPLVNPEADRRGNRFNSAGVDKQGRLWASTMALNHDKGKGSTYSLEPDLGVTRRLDVVQMPKNFAFDPSGRVAYFSDAAENAVFRFPLDPATGALGERDVLIRAGEDDGQFTGIAVDAEGCVWATCLGAWRIRRYAPDGAMLSELVLPTPMPTSCAFGGPDLSTLYITTSFIRVPAGLSAQAPASGYLLAANVGVRGQTPALFGARTA